MASTDGRCAGGMVSHVRELAPVAPRKWPRCSSFDLASHSDLKLARRIRSGLLGPTGQEVWAGTLSHGGGGGGVKRCKHRVAVKRVPLAARDRLEVVQEEVKWLRRASTLCRNVCTFHGAVRVGDHLCFVMDRYVGSVQAEMLQNGGRLTLEQILRSGVASKRQYLVILSSYSFCFCHANDRCKHITLQHSAHFYCYSVVSKN
ncbi:unnamed protein product [Miscanthus lutarioriparius]|uniref:Uncharacterized protein n=1 Tax=Miscanthus lutarioriparius TaxID=422564 RepID=A0A811PQF6_9POAL|nr:unnamed protein product [Miscanthus lutarioriparius]